MDKLLPLRGLIMQIAFLGALLYFAHIAPEMHNPIMVTLAGLGTLLTQRARAQAGSGTDAGGGNGDSLIPLAYKESGVQESKRPPMARRTPFRGLLTVLGLTWVLFAFFVCLAIAACQQTPAQVAHEIEAGAPIVSEVCQEIGVATGDPLVTLVCPFLDKDSKTPSDGGTITVVMPREQWSLIKTRKTTKP